MKTKCCDCCYPEIVGPEACDCCDGVEIVTPLHTANRPGLSQLSYRIGTHASFLKTMTARLASSDFPALKGLTARNAEDASIALLDSWATVADVLTFYQERIANEGYLRTATERRSILELARLVGYKLRPGVASSVYLAYTIDENSKEEVTIPAGSRAQSIPAPDEQPQSFETSEEIRARASWNNLKPRITQPQTSESIFNGPRGERVYLKGVNTNLQPGDPLLIGFGAATPDFYRVKVVEPNAALNHTLVTFQLPAGNEEGGTALVNPVELIKSLIARPSLQPVNRLRLNRTLANQFAPNAGAGYRAVSTFSPQLRTTLGIAAANAKVTKDNTLKVYALRQEASLFGHNVPKRTKIEANGEISIVGDWPIIEVLPGLNGGGLRIEHEEESAIYLDAKYTKIQSDSWLVVETQETRLTRSETLIVKPKEISTTQTRSEYGITVPTTRIALEEKWITLTGMDPSQITDNDFNALRSTVVYAQPELLPVAEEPIETAVCGGVDDLLELDGFYEDLESGRWVIVSGEREIEGTTGVRFSELAMLSSVNQDVARTPQENNGNGDIADRAGEKLHTFIKLAHSLAFCFKRDTVSIYGNVVKATQGETRQEVLGSGNGAAAMQALDLKQRPLTFTSASNASGVDSSLKVFVNELLWHEADTLADRQAGDRNFITRRDDEDTTTIVFGNGKQGARLPTGMENIKAEYRTGIGKPGNVKAGQISLLQTKPLGVKEVVNPLRASGGADREGRDQARKNAPLAVKALDRLVSVQDYEDFSRSYAGIGKARAVELSDGRRQWVHVTIAGADDIPIDTSSDLYRNLRRALHDFGDPYQPLLLAVRELMMLVASTNVRILPDYQWDPVVTEIRGALLNAFSFEQRELGQDVVLSEVICVMQAVRGVAYVDIDTLGGIPEKKTDAGERRLLTPDEISLEVQAMLNSSEEVGRPEPRLRVNLAKLEDGVALPAQLAFLTPDVPETIILNQIE